MDHLMPTTDLFKEDLAFLSENPEAFGLVADAYPIATDEWLVAANGADASDGGTPTYPMGEDGVDGLYDTLFGTLLERTDAGASILSRTFGEGAEQEEQPVSRYCAALSELTAARLLGGAARGASLEQSALMLGDELARALDALRTVICRDGLTDREADCFSVSLGICRLTDRGAGRYALDIFSAGDFHAYLLDAAGLCPVHMEPTAPLSPNDLGRPLPGRRIDLDHPEPFAVLLLSDSVCALNAAESRSLRETPGLIWRYRMRLEEHILRLITACLRAGELGERATRFFTGRARGRNAASGALLLPAACDYEALRTVAAARLAHLEDLIALLPDGYDPASVPPLADRAETEHAYIRHLLSQDHDLADRASEAVRLAALARLAAGADPDAPPPAEAPAYRRLALADVSPLFARYDAENAEDRAKAEANRAALRTQFADNWITLRPLLRTLVRDDGLSAETVAYRAATDRDAASAAALNARLGALLSDRRARAERLETLLSNGLATLRAEGNDWLAARAGDDSPVHWGESLAAALPAALADFLSDRRAASERYRALLVAYMTERDSLFARDTAAPHGFFAADWQSIYDGVLPDARWGALRDALTAAEAERLAATSDSDREEPLYDLFSDLPETADSVPSPPQAPDLTPYIDLLDVLSRISRGTGTRLARIEARAADRRAARDLSGDLDLLIAAVRASAYEDTAFDPSVTAVLTPSARQDYLTAVRRHADAQDRTRRRAEAYEGYRRMYEGLPLRGK